MDLPEIEDVENREELAELAKAPMPSRIPMGLQAVLVAVAVAWVTHKPWSTAR